jgi:hypothetical protein
VPATPLQPGLRRRRVASGQHRDHEKAATQDTSVDRMVGGVN